jgi:hypothetical protein
VAVAKARGFTLRLEAVTTTTETVPPETADAFRAMGPPGVQNGVGQAALRGSSIFVKLGRPLEYPDERTAIHA